MDIEQPSELLRQDIPLPYQDIHDGAGIPATSSLPSSIRQRTVAAAFDLEPVGSAEGATAVATDDNTCENIVLLLSLAATLLGFIASILAKVEMSSEATIKGVVAAYLFLVAAIIAAKKNLTGPFINLVIGLVKQILILVF
jgi:hypothetical protein